MLSQIDHGAFCSTSASNSSLNCHAWLVLSNRANWTNLTKGGWIKEKLNCHHVISILNHLLIQTFTLTVLEEETSLTMHQCFRDFMQFFFEFLSPSYVGAKATPLLLYHSVGAPYPMETSGSVPVLSIWFPHCLTPLAVTPQGRLELLIDEYSYHRKNLIVILGRPDSEGIPISGWHIFIHLGAAGNNVRDGFLCSHHRGLNQQPELNPKGLSGAKFGD